MSTQHLSISQAGVIALISQIVSFVAGFGIVNSTETGVIIAAATAVVNAAFLVANAVHHLATSNVVKASIEAQSAQVQLVQPHDPPLVP